MFEGKKNQDKTAVVAERQQEKELKLVGRIQPHRGHTLFKVDRETLEISKAEFETVDITFEQAQEGKRPSKKVIVEEGFVYVSALNEKNVIKKLPRLGVNINK